MQRKLLIAGNWKMNTTRDEAVALASALVEKVGTIEELDIAICPPFPYLFAVGEVIEDSNIALGAQDVFYEDNGAYTGEVSAAMLKDANCKFVICGHSERRHIIGETDELINRKLLKSIAEGLFPILCVGELLTERQAGETMEVVSQQVSRGLEGVSTTDMKSVTIAYEPVWAIGTGVNATPDQAEQVQAMIRQLIGQIYDPTVAKEMRILYGGSVKPDNAGELLACPDIDGALVGGARVKANDFCGIINHGLEVSQE